MIARQRAIDTELTYSSPYDTVSVSLEQIFHTTGVKNVHGGCTAE
jgi:hypothetical protein